MCCFFAALIFLGPRFAFLIWWMIPQGRAAINLTFDTYIVPLLGLIFLPWTTLMITFVYGVNGLVGWDWLWVGLAIAADIATYTGGIARRKDAPYYPPTGP
jgi:hypothetical protein